MSQRAGLSRLQGVPISNGKKCTMEARLNLSGSPLAAKFGKHLVAAGKVLADSTLPPRDPEPGDAARESD
jgi:hypothetical protein